MAKTKFNISRISRGNGKWQVILQNADKQPINCNLTGKPAIFDRQIQCSFFVRPIGAPPRGHLPPLGTPLRTIR